MGFINAGGTGGTGDGGGSTGPVVDATARTLAADAKATADFALEMAGEAAPQWQVDDLFSRVDTLETSPGGGGSGWEGTWDPVLDYPQGSFTYYDGSLYVADNAAATAVGVPPLGAPVPAYAQKVLASHPAAYWRLNDPTGATSAVDASGNGRPLTFGSGFVSTAGLTQEPTPLAGLFDGIANAFAPLDATVLRSSQLVFEAIVKAPTLTSSYFAGTGAPTNDNAAGGWAVGITSGGQWKVLIQDGLTTQSGTGGTVVAGQSYHVVLVWSLATGAPKLYVNGALVSLTGTMTGNHVRSANSLYLGSGVASGARFAGVIDEVALYTTILSPDDVAAHFAAYQTATAPPVASPGWVKLT